MVRDDIFDRNCHKRSSSVLYVVMDIEAPEKLRLFLQAVKDCSDRGLVEGAKWFVALIACSIA